MMDNLFTWYAATNETTAISTTTELPGDDEFNDILSALDKLKNI